MMTHSAFNISPIQIGAGKNTPRHSLPSHQHVSRVCQHVNITVFAETRAKLSDILSLSNDSHLSKVEKGLTILSTRYPYRKYSEIITVAP